MFETARWALQFYKWLLHDYNCKKVYADIEMYFYHILSI